MQQCGGLLKGVGGNDKVHRTHHPALSLSGQMKPRWRWERFVGEKNTHWRSCCTQSHTLCDKQAHTVHSYTHTVQTQANLLARKHIVAETTKYAKRQTANICWDRINDIENNGHGGGQAEIWVQAMFHQKGSKIQQTRGGSIVWLADLYQLSPSLQRVVAGTGTIVQILIKQIVATLDLRF